ncbi:MAG TPA: hypothetical protein VMV72_11885 [Verrucomicrobiae bacterium]|nr:hypothetical protein [Verrucomicrobiae bacterium]
MDISFTCGNCGKKLVIDDAGAGITIDCPDCGKPVYVPTAAPPPKPKDPPARVEPKPATRVAAPAPAPTPQPVRPAVIPSKPALSLPNGSRGLPASTPKQKPSVHPSIEAGVHCLVITVAIEFAGFFVARQNFLLAYGVLIPCEIFGVAAFLCAVYAMCIGHVKHGLLVLAGLALIAALSWWLVITMAGAIVQQMMEQPQKGFPFPTPHW